MNFFRRTTSTRFWIRTRRHSSGHYEAVLSGLTCQDVYDCLREEFDGKSLVLFSRPDLIDDGELFSRTLKVEHRPLSRGAKNPIYLISPSCVEKVLHAEPMNQNDHWWFFPCEEAIAPAKTRALGLAPDLRFFWTRPHEGLDFFVASVDDLTVFTKKRDQIERLIQKLFRKYAEGLGLLSAEEWEPLDFVRQFEMGLGSLESSGVGTEAQFTFVPDASPRILKDTARDRRRIVYEYLPKAQRFERTEVETLRLFTLLKENWGAIIVWLSSGILLVGTFIILLALLALVVAFVLSFIF
jgi:hypothetical protein